GNGEPGKGRASLLCQRARAGGFMWRRGMNAMYAQGSDSTTIHGNHFKLAPGNRNSVTHSGKTAELGERISAECGPVAFGNLHAMVGADIDQGHRAIQLENSIRLDRGPCSHVVFVSDVTDYFFDEIFHRDDAGCSSILVENDSHVRTCLSQIVENFFRRPGVRNVKRLARKLREI